MISAGNASALSISSTNNSADDNCTMYLSTPGGGGFILNVVRVVTISSGTQTWYLIGINNAAVVASNGTFSATRLG